MLKSTVGIILLMLAMASDLFAQFSGGAGTAESPFEIRTRAELMEVSNYPNSHFILKNNIRDSVRTPISEINNSTFNGNGYKVSLALYDTTSNNIVSLFKFANGDVTIKNLVVDGYVYGYWASGIIGDTEYTDSIRNYKLINCINLAKITGIACAGGLVHWTNNNMIIEQCINLVTCVADLAAAGGLISHFECAHLPGDSTLLINNSINAGFIASIGTSTLHCYASGILGYDTWFRSWMLISPPYRSKIRNSINIGIIKSNTDYLDPFLLILRY